MVSEKAENGSAFKRVLASFPADFCYNSKVERVKNWMDGILTLWKEPGMTSHDCVFKLRKILHMKKIGHGGTLDPAVSGVLPICLGKGTKVIEFLSDSGKVYEGEITLGFATDTEDASGTVVERTPLSEPFSNSAIDAAMKSMVGEITQIPPMYSAVKVNGRRLYEYARAGETVERPKRKALIASFERTTEPVWNPEEQTQSWRFKVSCGKGTYVRTLAYDTGKHLGSAACMTDLTRLASGGLTKEQSLTLAEVADAMAEGRLEEFILPIEYGLKEFQRLDLSPKLWARVKNGARLTLAEIGLEKMPTAPVALYYQDKAVSLYQANPKEENGLKPLKVLRTEME